MRALVENWVAGIVIPGVLWGFGPTIGMKIHHEGTEIAEKNWLEQGLRVSVVTDFRWSV